MMAITNFGKAVKKARIDADVSLSVMAIELGVSAPFLSALERGNKKISKGWVNGICQFFSGKGIHLDNLQELADISNGFVNLEHLPDEQQFLVTKLAKRPLSPEHIDLIFRTLDECVCVSPTRG
ncbi:MAG: helix-turn-helix domain-containing protein [Plesiomonas sp.]|uniref:helix-turn-helix domain-containing protein n=1 Tax=Plesiomonas sp. TaxID=2486279 RepID=UPI003F3CF7FB